MDTVLRTTIATVFGSSAADELKKVNVKLGEITDVLSTQASFGDSFPQHVYDFAKMESSATRLKAIRILTISSSTLVARKAIVHRRHLEFVGYKYGLAIAACGRYHGPSYHGTQNLR